MKIALYPGTFDPITIGHIDIAKRAAQLFDQVYVLVLDHQAKQTLFNVSKRCELAAEALHDVANIQVLPHNGLTLDMARKLNACALIRGVRQIKDYEYELNQAACNAHIDDRIETILLFAKPQYAFISSTAVKEFARYHQALDALVSPHVAEALEEAYRK